MSKCKHERRVLVAGEWRGERISRGIICKDCHAIRVVEKYGRRIPAPPMVRADIGQGRLCYGMATRLLRSRSPRATHPALPGVIGWRVTGCGLGCWRVLHSRRRQAAVLRAILDCGRVVAIVPRRPS